MFILLYMAMGVMCFFFEVTHCVTFFQGNLLRLQNNIYTSITSSFCADKSFHNYEIYFLFFLIYNTLCQHLLLIKFFLIILHYKNKMMFLRHWWLRIWIWSFFVCFVYVFDFLFYEQEIPQCIFSLFKVFILITDFVGTPPQKKSRYLRFKNNNNNAF